MKEDLYNQALKFATKLAKNTSVDPMDLVHEAILVEFDDQEKLFKKIKNLFIVEHTRLKTNSLCIDFVLKGSHRTLLGETSKQCKICKDDKSINEFRSFGHKEIPGLTCYSSYCKSCEIRNNMRWAKTHPELVKASYRRSYKNNPEKWKLKGKLGRQKQKVNNPNYRVKARLRNKRYWIREKEKVSDKYIVRNLSRHRDKSTITQEMIDKSRTRILKRRFKIGI